MAKEARFLIKCDEGEEYDISIKVSKLTGTTEIKIGEDTYKLKGRFLNPAREEPFKIGDEMAILSIDKRGKIEIKR